MRMLLAHGRWGGQKEGKVHFQLLQVCACSPLKALPPPKKKYACTHSPFSNPIPKCIQNPEVGGSGRWIVTLMSLFEASCYLGKLASKILGFFFLKKKNHLSHTNFPNTRTQKKVINSSWGSSSHAAVPFPQLC